MDKSKDQKSTLSPENTQKLFHAAMAIFILALLLLIVSLGIEHRTKQSPKRYTETQTPFHPGQTISLGNVNMTVDSPNYSDGQTPFTAPAGKHYVMFYLTIRNLSEKPINILPSSDTYLKDFSGNVTYLTPFSLTDPFKAGELLPGESIRGQLSFLAPRDGNFKFYVDAIWSGGVVPFSLN